MYFIGVDVSKNSLDICIIKNNKNSFFKIDNNLHSINDFFIKFIDKKVSIAFESTSHYSDKLASILTNLDLIYRELSPSKISNILKFLSNKKSDQIDAYNIALCIKKFSDILQTSKYDSNYKLIQSYNATLKLFVKIRTQLKNFKSSKEFVVDDNLNGIIKDLQIYLKKLDDKLTNISYELLKNYIPASEKIISNSVGVGKKLAICLFPILQKNKEFSYKNIISYLGLAPRIFESGISVKKSRCINKKGNSYIRSILFMSTLSAIRNNEIIKEKFNSLVSKGKNKKVAIVACMCAMIKWLKNLYFNEKKILSSY